MQTAYALHNTDSGPVLMVFTSRASRDAFCFRTLFTGNRAQRITGDEARRLYGRRPTNDGPLFFRILPIPAMA
jgi:hypothetical protein